jgi:single-strand DNA-binding protein
MANLNKVLLIGNLTRDPEVRYTPSQRAVGDLRLAMNRRFKASDGQMRDEPCYVDVVVWERQAEIAREYLRRGSPVLIEGRLQYDEWEKDGKKSSRLRVVCERLQLMGSRGEGREGAEGGGPRRAAGSGEEAGTEEIDDRPAAGGPAARASAPPPADAGAQPNGKPGKDEDDLPF